MGKYMSTKELSEALSIPTYSILKFVREGKFPGYRIGKKKYWFDYDEVISAIRNYSLNNHGKDMYIHDSATDTRREV